MFENGKIEESRKHRRWFSYSRKAMIFIETSSYTPIIQILINSTYNQLNFGTSNEFELYFPVRVLCCRFRNTIVHIQACFQQA